MSSNPLMSFIGTTIAATTITWSLCQMPGLVAGQPVAERLADLARNFTVGASRSAEIDGCRITITKPQTPPFSQIPDNLTIKVDNNTLVQVEHDPMQTLAQEAAQVLTNDLPGNAQTREQAPEGLVPNWRLANIPALPTLAPRTTVDLTCNNPSAEERTVRCYITAWQDVPQSPSSRMLMPPQLHSCHPVEVTLAAGEQRQITISLTEPLDPSARLVLVDEAVGTVATRAVQMTDHQSGPASINVMQRQQHLQQAIKLISETGQQVDS